MANQRLWAAERRDADRWRVNEIERLHRTQVLLDVKHVVDTHFDHGFLGPEGMEIWRKGVPMGVLNNVVRALMGKEVSKAGRRNDMFEWIWTHVYDGGMVDFGGAPKIPGYLRSWSNPIHAEWALMMPTLTEDYQERLNEDIHRDPPWRGRTRH